MDTGHWRTIGEFDPSEWFGFIYRIIDLENGREYIGKKQFEKVRRKKVTGKTRRKIVRSSSDWRSYTSSSKHVNEAIEEKGMDKFLFLIESLHKTKAGLFYAEIEAQVNEDVLRAKLPNGERKFYNGMVGNVKFIPPMETPEEAANRVSTIKRQFMRNPYHQGAEGITEGDAVRWDAQYRVGGRNHQTNTGGLDPAEQAAFTRAIDPKTQDQFDIDFGRPVVVPEEAVVKEPKPKPKAKAKPKAKPKSKAKPKATPVSTKEMVTCPHCGKEGAKSGMARYHFENCKKKED